MFLSNTKKKGAARKAGPNPVLTTGESVVIELIDGGGNPSTVPDPTTVTATLSTSDPTVVTVSPDTTTMPVSPLNFTATILKAGTITFSGSVTFNAGTPGPFTAITGPVDVPAPPPGPPVAIKIILGGNPI